MDQKYDLKAMDDKIHSLRRDTEALKKMSDDFPALYRNTSRILASIKMLELNVSDLLEMGLED